MSGVVPGTVAVLGGTFDPVHLGHLGVASGAMRLLGLDRVLLVPAAIPPHKRTATISPERHRLAMLRLAVEDRPGVEVDPIEIDRGGVSFTIDTLRAVRSRPGVAGVVFLLGMDSLAEFPGWREADRLVAEFDVVVVDRPGHGLEAVRAATHEIVARRLVGWDEFRIGASAPLGTGGRIVHAPVGPIEVSSHEVRRAVAAGEALDALVPPAVARYIRDHGLYRSRAADAADAADGEGGSTLTPEIAACIAAARDKKAEDLVVLDLRKSDFTDYLVICHGTNDRQILAIADEIEARVRSACGVKPSHVEGRRESSWILMDYIDFVVHVFDPDKRRFYRLERLWGDAPRVDLPAEGPPASTPGAAAP